MVWIAVCLHRGIEFLIATENIVISPVLGVLPAGDAAQLGGRVPSRAAGAGRARGVRGGRGARRAAARPARGVRGPEGRP